MASFCVHQTLRVVSLSSLGQGQGDSAAGQPLVGDVGNVVDIPGPHVYTVECSNPDGSLAWITELRSVDLKPVGPLPFEVESVTSYLGRLLVVARRLFAHSFSVLPGTRLAGFDVTECDSSTSIDEQGNRRADVFGFYFAEGSNPECVPGEVLYLEY